MSISNKIVKIKLKRWIKKGLIVGDNFKINVGCTIEPTFPWLVRVGNNVTLGPNVTILAHDASSKVHLQYTKLGLITIGDNVFIGAGSIILPGVQIGSNVVIGAGSVVNADVPNDCVVVGAPARVVKSIDEFKSKNSQRMNKQNLLDGSYTPSGKITEEKKQEMIRMLKNGEVYIV